MDEIFCVFGVPGEDERVAVQRVEVRTDQVRKAVLVAHYVVYLSLTYERSGRDIPATTKLITGSCALRAR